MRPACNCRQPWVSLAFADLSVLPLPLAVFDNFVNQAFSPTLLRFEPCAIFAFFILGQNWTTQNKSNLAATILVATACLLVHLFLLLHVVFYESTEYAIFTRATSLPNKARLFRALRPGRDICSVD